jgi:predicted Na+-dependent transporter
VLAASSGSYFYLARRFAFFAGNLSFGGWLLTGFFLQAGSLKLSRLILPLLQIIIFWMGTELSIKEFLTAIVFSFPKEIAAGIILVGCCPSGLASIKTSFVTRGKPVVSKSSRVVNNLMISTGAIITTYHHY